MGPCPTWASRRHAATTMMMVSAWREPCPHMYFSTRYQNHCLSDHPALDHHRPSFRLRTPPRPHFRMGETLLLRTRCEPALPDTPLPSSPRGPFPLVLKQTPRKCVRRQAP